MLDERKKKSDLRSIYASYEKHHPDITESSNTQYSAVFFSEYIDHN